MNNLVIPPSPNWYENHILACAPDETLVYGAYTSLVIIQPKVDQQAANIKIISFAHNQRIIAVSLNPNWNDATKFIVSSGEDKSIKLWNCDTQELVASHKAHSTNETKLIGALFAGPEKIVSVSEDGTIFVWKSAVNEVVPFKNLLGAKVQVTCFSSCPHAPWLFAFGLNNGMIIVADLRTSGHVKHRLRGYDKKICSLTWCPVPVNVFPKPKMNKISLQEKPKESKLLSENDSTQVINSCVDLTSIHTIITSDTQCVGNSSTVCDVNSVGDPKIKCDNNGGRPIKKKNPWVDLKHADDDDLPPEDDLKRVEGVESDFLKECEALREKLACVKDQSTDTIEPDEPKDRKILIAKTKNRVGHESYLETAANDKTSKPRILPYIVIPRGSLFNTGHKQKTNNLQTNCCSLANVEQITIGVTDLNMHGSDSCTDAQLENEAPFFDNCDSIISKKEPTNNNTKDDECLLLIENTNESTDVNLNETVDNLTKLNSTLENNEQLPIGNSIVAKSEEVESDIKETKLENNMVCPTKEFLLASASSKGSITIWRAGSDGKVQLKVSVGSNSKFKSSKARDSFWIAMSWISPKVLLSSGRKGELLQWNLSDYNTGILQPKIVHNDHQSVLFSIAVPFYKNVSVTEDQNWRETCSLFAWTIGQERTLFKTSIDIQRTTLSCYPTLVKSVQIFSVSPIDPHKVAIGFADGTIRMWDLSRPHLDCITMSNFKLKSVKITALVWHLDEEGVLAYGSEEGHIGLINANSPAKPPTNFIHYFRSAIHHLEWGLMKERNGLFVCSEGVLVFYDMKKLLEDPFLIKISNDKYITQFAWKPDNSLLAIGTKDGQILLFSKHLEHVLSIFYQKKIITSLCWHFPATSEDDDLSPHEFYLASATIDGLIVVYDLRNFSKSDNDVTKMIVGQFNEHSKFIHSMCWSPHEGGMLVSASEDGSAHIWNVNKTELKCTFLNINVQPITACIWSPIDKNFIISGGRECSIQIWNVNDFKPLKQEDIRKEGIKQKARLQSIGSSHSSTAINSNIHTTNKKSLNRDSILSSVSSLQGEVDTLLNDCNQLLILKDNAADSHDKISDSSRVLQLFGNQKDVHNLVQYQKEQHVIKGKNILQQHLCLWEGDVAETIKSAIEKEQLSPWLISMASAVSPVLWQEACLSYAKYLEENSHGDGVEAASYYLACHQVEDAINVLCSKKLFREALVLCKCRMPTNEVFINEILTKWASFYLTNGSYEIAAQCYIAMGKFEDAATALYKRSDLKSLEVAMKLAERSNNPEMVGAINFRYNALLSETTCTEETVLPLRTEAVLIAENQNMNDGVMEEAALSAENKNINDSVIEGTVLTEEIKNINDSVMEETALTAENKNINDGVVEKAVLTAENKNINNSVMEESVLTTENKNLNDSVMEGQP